MYTLLECHINLDLEGFEDVGSDGQPTGIKLPYIVTVEEGSRTVLSIRRNYAPNDLKKNKIQYFVHFKFLPGLGFYGFGLIHMIGGLSRTATAALRQLLDAGTLSNLPAMFQSWYDLQDSLSLVVHHISLHGNQPKDAPSSS